MSEKNPFTVGALVAVVHHHWDRRISGKRRILKVHANGNFTISCPLEENASDERKRWAKECEKQQWRPSLGGMPVAYKTSDRGFSRSDHLEPWTDRIVEEIRYRKQQQGLRERLGKVKAYIDGFTQADRAGLTVEFIAALEAAVLKDHQQRQEEYDRLLG